MVSIIWDLTKPLPRRSVNEKVVIKPVSKDNLRDVGKILVVTWRGFIKSPETTERRVVPYLSAGLEQPFIAYLRTKPVGCVSPRLDVESKVGILDGGVHVLPQYRRQRIGTTLLLTALRWLRNRGMEKAKVTPFNPEGEDAIQRAIAFYISTGGTVSE
ncbi:MAG: GNAT family N-acetyltransferase [Candidatus Bathyarchaeia archaeon]